MKCWNNLDKECFENECAAWKEERCMAVAAWQKIHSYIGGV